MAASEEYRKCFALFAQRDYQGCSHLAMPLIDQVKTHELLQIFLISLYRSGQHAFAAKLTPAINQATAHDPWTNALQRLTTGQCGPDDLRPLMRDTKQVCQAWYYIGANQLTHAYLENAHRSFDVALATGVRCTEADLAQWERNAPVVSVVAQRSGMTDQLFDWFNQQARAAGQACKNGRRDEAITIARDMFQRACDTLNEDGVAMGAAMQQVAMIYFFLGDHAAARPIFQEASDLFRENYGPRFRMYVECLQQLAAIAVATGSASQATDLLREKKRLTALVLESGDGSAPTA
jgi:hypothetical protein